MADEFRYVQDGMCYAGTPKWEVFVSVTNTYVGYVASTTSRIGGTVWMACTPDGKTTRGHRNRPAAATYLRAKAEEVDDAQASDSESAEAIA